MEEIQKLLPLFGFLGTICSAIIAALLCKSITEDLKLTIRDLSIEVQEIKIQMTEIKTICRLTHSRSIL
jgi:hypothetical protein